MTECDRLIAEGKFSREWFKPEVRCDFLVDENRKKVWAIILDLLDQFKTICEKHGLKWCANGGTMLGAIRHGGMIPWDDDIDIDMPRADYEKFLKLGDEFSHPYFLKVPGENGYLCSFAKLCNSNTAAIYESVKYCAYNQGIFLDISPIDVVDIRDGEKNFSEIDRLNRANGLIMRMTHPNSSELDRQRFSELKDRDGITNLRRIDALARMYENKSCDGIGSLVFTGYPYRRNVWRKEWYSEFVKKPFENTMMNVPVGYDESLRTTFGAYMECPPVEERGARHNNFFFDPDRPYTSYLA